jgi:hypothetical protein
MLLDVRVEVNTNSVQAYMAGVDDGSVAVGEMGFKNAMEKLVIGEAGFFEAVNPIPHVPQSPMPTANVGHSVFEQEVEFVKAIHEAEFELAYPETSANHEEEASASSAISITPAHSPTPSDSTVDTYPMSQGMFDCLHRYRETVKAIIGQMTPEEKLRFQELGDHVHNCTRPGSPWATVLTDDDLAPTRDCKTQ